jgi:hypothetical protein
LAPHHQRMKEKFDRLDAMIGQALKGGGEERIAAQHKEGEAHGT